jgi:hypothetical protein
MVSTLRSIPSTRPRWTFAYLTFGLEGDLKGCDHHRRMNSEDARCRIPAPNADEQRSAHVKRSKRHRKENLFVIFDELQLGEKYVETSRRERSAFFGAAAKSA